ncbi:MAG: M28 family metallopeptidase [Pseudomonadota bacterium]
MKWSNLDEQGMRPVSRPGRLRAFFAVLGLSSGLAACGDGATSVESPPSTETAIAPTTVIDEVILRQRIKTLSSDEFAGRAPVTEGGAKTRAFLIEEMKAIGLVPGNGDSYEQQVPLVEVTVDPAQSSLTINGEDLTYGPQTVYWTKRVEESVSIQDTEMVFVGYGIVAPEYGWDDYAGLDVTNKTVVMLVNDPGFATQDDAVFNGNAMTYYGRWTYKYEEAARQGAAAALVIHQTKPAAYGWGVVEGSWSGPQLDLERPDGGASRVAVEGWLHEDQARALFSSASLDFDDVTSSASAPGFKPVSIPGQTLSASLTNTIKKSESANVAGILTGTTYPDEYVLYMGHWDHLGAGEGTGDTIFNGAVDNATGTAGILSVVEAFAKNETRPERSILVVGVTAEESGLLGSAYLAEDPIVPLSQIVAGINIDAMLPTPPSKDLIVVGYGASEVEDILEDVAAARGKYLRPDPEPEKGYFYRSDHISLAKKGVPMLYADAGIDFVEGGTDAGSAFVADYAANRYHKPADEYTDDWEIGTLIDTLSIFYEVGAALAYSDSWPNWNEGNEFRAIRDAQRPDEDTGD